MYQEEEKARLKRQHTKEAIALAMQSRWEEAVTVNRNIVESFPTDVDAYNRLGRALIELGEYQQAKDAYKKALALDHDNSISRKNLERLSLLQEEQLPRKRDLHKVAPQLFVEETGKTSVVTLLDLAPLGLLAKMVAGDQVNLSIKGQSLIVESTLNEYIGRVEPKYALRLVKLMQGGNKYSAAIASMGQEGTKVIISEVFQDPSQVGKLSFPVKETPGFRPYIRESILRREVAEEIMDEEEEYPSEEEEERKSLAEGFSLVGGEIISPEVTDEEIGEEE